MVKYLGMETGLKNCQLQTPESIGQATGHLKNKKSVDLSTWSHVPHFVDQR